MDNSKLKKKREQVNDVKKEKKKQISTQENKTWQSFIYDKTIKEKDIKTRLINEIMDITKKYSSEFKDYTILYLHDTHFKINPFASDRMYTSLSNISSTNEKNVLLIIASTGGSIEPAYQISKICCIFSKDKFIVVVPRAAKSSATLICLGAHEIHMGLLSELGPIDPQINGRPVLGLSYSLEQIAKICVKYPKSSEMFSEYLTKSLYVA